MLLNKPYVYLEKHGGNNFTLHVAITLESGIKIDSLDLDFINTAAKARIMNLNVSQGSPSGGLQTISTNINNPNRADEDFIVVNVIANGFDFQDDPGLGGGTSYDP